MDILVSLGRHFLVLFSLDCGDPNIQSCLVKLIFDLFGVSPPNKIFGSSLMVECEPELVECEPDGSCTAEVPSLERWILFFFLNLLMF